MRPYCPRCFGEADGEVPLRCPLDHHLLAVRACPECSGELSPRDRFCAHCGHRVVRELGRLLIPPTTPLWRQKLGLALDIFSMVLVAALHLAERSLLGALLLGFGSALLYRGWARSGSGQSFGQAVVGSFTVRLNGEPLSFWDGMIRTLYECALFSIAWTNSASRRLEVATGSCEVRFG